MHLSSPNTHTVSFEIVRHGELFAYFSQAFDYCVVQRDAMLSSLLCGLEFNLARHINALLPFDGRGGFQLSNQPVHIFLEFICRPKRIDAQRTEEMTAGVLIGIKRSRRPRQHAAKDFDENCKPVALVAAAFTRPAERQ